MTSTLNCRAYEYAVTGLRRRAVSYRARGHLLPYLFINPTIAYTIYSSEYQAVRVAYHGGLQNISLKLFDGCLLLIIHCNYLCDIYIVRRARYINWNEVERMSSSGKQNTGCHRHWWNTIVVVNMLHRTDCTITSWFSRDHCSFRSSLVILILLVSLAYCVQSHTARRWPVERTSWRRTHFISVTTFFPASP